MKKLGNSNSIKNNLSYAYPYLVKFYRDSIINLRPTSLNICTGYLPFYGSNCGLKGAAILHNWLPCAVQSCGTQALAVPFCFGKVIAYLKNNKIIMANNKKYNEFKEQINKNKIELEKLNLENDARNQIDWFRNHCKQKSTEEVLFNMAKYLVQIKNKYNRQENFFMAVLSSVAFGSIFGGIIFIVSGDWVNLFWCVIIFILGVIVAISVYGKN